ncbi:MAG: hypothetical protein J6Q84_07195 [Kiritimatiellae bacterium]|nr:hypothetical protein [Kiritimatiellia bacterium]
MSNKLLCIFAFSAGAAIGSLVTQKLIKAEYERIADEEIESVKKIFSEKKRAYEEAEYEREQAAILAGAYNTVEDDELPSEESEKGDDEPVRDEKIYDEPYVISPEEFGENDDYEIETFTHYADGVLVDESDERVDDIDGTVGEDYAEHFGEYEADSVFIRNDATKHDYEILYDSRNYNSDEE